MRRRRRLFHEPPPRRVTARSTIIPPGRSGSAAWNGDSRTPKEEPMNTYVENAGVPAFLVHEASAFRPGRRA
jgi:hypothetical protein